MRSLVAVIALVLLPGPGVMAGCAGSELPDEVVPSLRPRPDLAYCLASLEVSDDPDFAVAPPTVLSATGCFEDLATLAPAPDLVPYRILSQLWTDGVIKQRFLVLPPGQSIDVTAQGAWTFPPGSVLIKAFVLEERVGDPASRRSVETRFMVRAGGAWQFFSYKWNDEGTEGFLNERAHTVEMTVDDGGTPLVIAFDFPARDGCVACHASVTGVALGPRTWQLNQELRYEHGPENQLTAMEAIGLFREPLGRAPEDLPALVDPADPRAPMELRARSYLHGNCAHCHQPGGYNSLLIDLDLRYDTALADAQACDEPIKHRIHIGDGELVIDPGHPASSNLYGRMLHNGISKMPPLGRSLVDPLGESVVRAWIESLDGCP